MEDLPYEAGDSGLGHQFQLQTQKSHPNTQKKPEIQSLSKECTAAKNKIDK